MGEEYGKKFTPQQACKIENIRRIEYLTIVLADSSDHFFRSSPLSTNPYLYSRDCPERRLDHQLQTMREGVGEEPLLVGAGEAGQQQHPYRAEREPRLCPQI